MERFTLFINFKSISFYLHAKAIFKHLVFPFLVVENLDNGNSLQKHIVM